MGQVSANGHGTGHVQLFSFNILICFSYILRRQAVQPLQRLSLIPTAAFGQLQECFMTMRRFLLLGSARERLCSATVVGLLASGLAGPAFAGQADICYSPAASSDAPNKLTASTALDCPQAGHHTLAQLAQAGWSVASVQPVVVDYGADPATHTPHSATSWMLVIQRDAH